MKRVHYSESDGCNIVGYYDDDLHDTIPLPNIEVDDNVWQNCIENQGRVRVDLDTKQIVELPSSTDPLTDSKAIACYNIDFKAGEVRNSHVSPGQLVDQEYKLAEHEATEYLTAIAANAGDPTGITVPLSVQSWADVMSQTPTWAAQDIIDTAGQLYNVLQDVRAARLNGKAVVNAAADHAAVDAAEAAALAALDAIRAP